MNTISKVLLSGVILAVLACVWFLLTQKNKSGFGCSGNCASCSEACTRRDQDADKK